MASTPPTIFSPARRAATRGRIARLQHGSDSARFVIDDIAGVTLAAASTHEQSFEGYGGNAEAAAKVGALAAERAKAAGITKVVFDRGGNRYHGRVKALADAARDAGLEF